MKIGEARGCQCGKSLYIATAKVADGQSTLCSADVIGAIESKVVVGCAKKNATIGKHKLRNVSHISLPCLSKEVRSIVGKLHACFYKHHLYKNREPQIWPKN